MRGLIVGGLIQLMVVNAASSPVCHIGTWSGSTADLAAIEAVYQREQAEAAQQTYPQGAPVISPWSGVVRCR